MRNGNKTKRSFDFSAVTPIFLLAILLTAGFAAAADKKEPAPIEIVVEAAP